MPIFLSDSLFMLPLLLCSVVAVAVIVHRMVSLRATNVLPQALTTALRDADAETIRNQVEDDRSSLGRVCQQALTKQHPNRAAATSSAETYAREEISKLQAGLTTLEVIITIAPLLGPARNCFRSGHCILWTGSQRKPSPLWFRNRTGHRGSTEHDHRRTCRRCPCSHRSWLLPKKD